MTKAKHGKNPLALQCFISGVSFFQNFSFYLILLKKSSPKKVTYLWTSIYVY